jgi:hypothetical protein
VDGNRNSLDKCIKKYITYLKVKMSFASNKKKNGFASPIKDKPKKETSKKDNLKAAHVKKKHVDIVTGKAMASVFFDPSKAIDCNNTNYDWIGENLYVPASVVKEEGDILTVCLPNGEIYRMSEANRVTDNDDEGVDDILKLRDFSEQSLVHTLRIRYYKDEIYTFVGPILISLNPYKKIKDIYTANTVEMYHGRKQVFRSY